MYFRLLVSNKATFFAPHSFCKTNPSIKRKLHLRTLERNVN